MANVELRERNPSGLLPSFLWVWNCRRTEAFRLEKRGLQSPKLRSHC